ncbi:SCP2 sterol-binding domain-containing protein [Candidatus Berkiella cookevillensis]|uniref:SCP2 sterol-binding domain-containing protein n=1 Tax=Candidatus Berkiella cookevillensis TaxID=437022 RepID=A0A0Q9YDY7_9GAMM|nr:SCP2 sterol-binding domain-containing protein [Candidatus Berkiella cookevillensis]MCS5709633.1 SCP2 sterol-binding domain-containing protein [Candidatus Berkiella cookevillensis]
MQHKALHFIFSSLKTLVRKLDPYVFDPLEAHENKLIGIEIQNVLTLTLQVQNKDLLLIDSDSLQASDQYDCFIQGRLASFLDIIFKYKMFVPGQGITLKGDTHLAQAFFNCFKQMDPDCASIFEQQLPAPFVALLSLLSNNLSAELKLWHKNRKGNLRTFLQDETQCLPSKGSVQQFEVHLSNLMQQFEHLDAKLNKLMTYKVPSI